MKKTISALILSALSMGAFSQTTFDGRLPIENTTDYTAFPLQGGPRKVGTPGYPLPKEGTVKVPVILVQFADKKFTVAETETAVTDLYDKTCNGEKAGEIYKEGISYSSVRDYFVHMSDSIFLPEFEIIGPVTLDNGYAYYGDDSKGKDWRINEFYADACRKAILEFNVDWNKFDNNNDNKVDMAFFIYAGEGQNDSKTDDPNTIWPKEGTSQLDVTVTYESGKSEVITFGAFGCTNEIYRGKMDGIGTMCHELSHGLGLCDHYDYIHINFGMDYWDVMDSGCYAFGGKSPVGYSAYERDFLGWRPLQNLQLDADTTITIEPLILQGQAYKLQDPNDANHYYILENRQSYLFDTYVGLMGGAYNGIQLKGNNHGLMITEVLYDKTSWSSNRINTGNTEHLTIVPADGELISQWVTNDHLTSYLLSMLGDLYPGYTNNTELRLLGQTFEITEVPITINGEQINNIILKQNEGSATPTAIHEVQPYTTPLSSSYFDLSGRKILTPHNGILIRNGKKYLQK